MDNVDQYISALKSDQAEIVKKLRAFIMSDFPQLKEEYKWNRPVYTLHGKDAVYIQATQLGANFGLTKGAQLDDPKGLLEGTGKDMRHVKIDNSDSLDLSYMNQLVTQCLSVLKNSD